MNEAVKRNSIRFPVDFMFRLSAEKFTSLISQFAISNFPSRFAAFSASFFFVVVE